MNRRRPRTRLRTVAVTALCALSALAVVACGSSSSSSKSTKTVAGALPAPKEVTLILDFVPNAVHAGIYRAVAEN